ncbi:MAG TPA: GTP cyclohydrolase I FolE [Ruminococcaceae bacterium]|nr:GTP cyclohydrolase I FolE [Oscillospiraceae bacterium]
MDKERIEKAVRELLLAIGEDPDREGLVETPARVARMYEEIFAGMEDDPKKYLKVFNEDNNDEMVVVRDIPIYSVCEHHLIPFFGKAHIAYIPGNGKVIGLSKLARIVNCFAKKPQLQERLTAQVADFLEENLQPKGLAVVIEAEHLCMTMRGARASGAQTRTSALRGCMKSDARTRAETMTLLAGK